jgi:ADP-heptose:LPS heptosyltransferase
VERQAGRWSSIAGAKRDSPTAVEASLFCGTRMGDFADTAALIEQLDLVIAIDNAVAHLAGAPGKPVWVLLPAAPDWRCLLERTDSPGYPTARLFRVTQDWDELIRRLSSDLADRRPRIKVART